MEKKQEIFKELKRRLNYLQDELGYDVLFIALQGSQNYGLDIYTEEYKSDIDCMAIVLPSFDEFVDNKPAVSTTLVLDNNEHINIKDIRLMFELFYKQNIQFLEILFTEYKIVNKKYRNEVNELLKNAEFIASYNNLKLLNGISGMAMEKLKALEHPYPSIKDKIEKYGYCYTSDTKFLTNTGWKFYDDIDDNDLLGTVNQVNLSLEFQNFTNRYKYKCKEGYVYDINSRHSRFKITENHNIFSSKVININKNGKAYIDDNANWSFETVQNCTEGNYNRHILAFPKNKNDEYNISDEMLYIYGAYVSEGTILFRDKSKLNIKEARITQRKINQEFRDILNRCVSKYNGNIYTYTHNGGDETVWCFNKTEAEQLYNNCNYLSHRIHLPYFIYKLSQRQCRLMLKTLLLGDGTNKIDTENRYVYYTTSEALAEDIVSLAYLSGYTGKKQVGYVHRDGTHYGNKPVYQVMIQFIDNRPFMINTSLNNKHSNIHKVAYTNDVVCFTVPNSLLITMCEGKVAVQSNCGKQLSHIIRLYQFIISITSGVTFKKALTYFEDNIKAMVMKAKLNEYSLEEARQLAQKYADKIYNIKESEILAKGVIVNDEVVILLLNIKSKILKKCFTEQLLPEVTEPYKLCPDHYRNVWITSDTHFGHKNILEYENRVAKLKVNTVEEHDKELIKRWNNKVGKNDLIIILGDFSFMRAEATNELLKILNGDKVLVRGNHDIFLDDKKFNKSLFKAIYDYKETKYKGQEIALMHYPIQDFKHMNREVPAVLLFGHIHTFRIPIPKHSYNVGVDVNNYYPVKLEVAIERALTNEGGRINNDNE